jgi:phosphoserine phosphatase
MPAPLNGNSMVYTTANLPAGSKIIVGGPLVNSLASSVADQLNAAGDKVAMVSGSNIIVAGYTADDTGAAAQMLIDALDSI